MKFNETGEAQYHKITLRDTVRIKIKVFILRIKNWDAERWYQKHGK